jgi:hypothetical protein
MRTKFKVKSVLEEIDSSTLVLIPVLNGSEENKKFFKWTPSGEIRIGTINTEVIKEFRPGAEYYVDFTLATAEGGSKD